MLKDFKEKSMLEKANKSKLRIERKACKSLVKSFKRKLSQSVKDGLIVGYADMSDISIWIDVSYCFYDDIYKMALEELKKYYGDTVKMEIEYYGCNNTHRRLKGIISE